jgi:hypothetical protein
MISECVCEGGECFLEEVSICKSRLRKEDLLSWMQEGTIVSNEGSKKTKRESEFSPSLFLN